MPAQRETRMAFDPDPASARAARRFLQSTLDDWGASHFVETATLLVSEVVTNVVLHARTAAELVLGLRGDRLRVEVHDANPMLPQLKVYGPGATTGRGMGMVGAMSSHHGVDRTATGKRVWFELDPADGALAAAAPGVDSFFDASIDDLESLELALSGGAPPQESAPPGRADADQAGGASTVGAR